MTGFKKAFADNLAMSAYTLSDRFSELITTAESQAHYHDTLTTFANSLADTFNVGTETLVDVPDCVAQENIDDHDDETSIDARDFEVQNSKTSIPPTMLTSMTMNIPTWMIWLGVMMNAMLITIIQIWRSWIGVMNAMLTMIILIWMRLTGGLMQSWLLPNGLTSVCMSSWISFRLKVAVTLMSQCVKLRIILARARIWPPLSLSVLLLILSHLPCRLIVLTLV
jgi:hypothetical protein